MRVLGRALKVRQRFLRIGQRMLGITPDGGALRRGLNVAFACASAVPVGVAPVPRVSEPQRRAS